MSSGLQVSHPFSLLLFGESGRCFHHGLLLLLNPLSDLFICTEPHEVTIQDSQGRDHRLSRYTAHWDQSRPECSTIVSVCIKYAH